MAALSGMWLRQLLLVAGSLLSLSCAPIASWASVTCHTPTAEGAVVDSEERCQYILKFDPDGTAPDDRVVRLMGLRNGESARSIAIVVAIVHYKNSRYDVKATEGDARALKEFLMQDQQFNEVIVLQDSAATMDNIRYFLRKYSMDRTTEYEGRVRLIFAYSGHGVPMRFFGTGKDANSRQPSVGIALYDAQDDEDYQNIYGLAEMRALFNDLAKNTFHFLALFNTCYGGDVFGIGQQGSSSSEPSKPGAWAITAGEDDEQAYTDVSGDGSLFFQTLIRGIKTGKADQDALKATLGAPGAVKRFAGIVRLGELDGYLSGHMEQALDPSVASAPASHHWMGSVEPANLHADGGFFFLQSGLNPGKVSSTMTLGTAFRSNVIAPAINEASVQQQSSVGYEDPFASLRSKSGPIYGIDVSHFNGDIDWQAVASQDVQFAYVKATQSNQRVDPTFAKNRSGAKAAGITTGVYHVYSFCSDPHEQLDNLKSVLKGSAEDDLPIALDVELFEHQEASSIGYLAKEGGCAFAQGPDGIRQRVGFLLKALEEFSGKRPILYGNDYVLDRVLGPELTAAYPLWRVKLTLKNDAPKGPWAMWQFTSNQHLPGVPAGNVDVNVLSPARPTKILQ